MAFQKLRSIRFANDPCFFTRNKSPVTRYPLQRQRRLPSTLAARPLCGHPIHYPLRAFAIVKKSSRILRIVGRELANKSIF